MLAKGLRDAGARSTPLSTVAETMRDRCDSLIRLCMVRLIKHQQRDLLHTQETMGERVEDELGGDNEAVKVLEVVSPFGGTAEVDAKSAEELADAEGGAARTSMHCEFAALAYGREGADEAGGRLTCMRACQLAGARAGRSL